MSKNKRNALCPCGSGLKYKNCCEEKEVLGRAEKYFDERAQEKAQELEVHLKGELPDAVYAGVLFAVWMSLGAHTSERSFEPTLPQLEAFFRDIYGHDLDRDALNKIVPPVPKDKLKNLVQFEILP